VTDLEHDDRDPLLVRPFLQTDSGDPSTQTWPSATTREVRSHRAVAADPPASPVPPATSPGRHRGLIVAVTGAVVLAAAGAAGYAALRPGFRPSVTTARPDSPLPAVSGPQASRPAPSEAPAQGASPSAGSSRRNHAGSASAGPTATGSAKAGAAVTTSAGAGSSGPASTPAATGAGPATSSPAGESGSVTVQPAPPAALAPNFTAGRTGAIGAQNNLCLDLDGGVGFPDNHVQVYDCNGTVAQRWTLGGDGSLRVAGMCALVVGDSTVHIVSCDGRTTARWSVSGHTLVNAADGQCLTDPSNGTKRLTGVTLARCSGAANQSWSLP
jgi:hypothetical protein